MRTVVGVLRGGPSSEYEVSLKTGASVLEALNREKYEARDIFIDRQGVWHLHGVAVTPERAVRDLDVAFNAMHGEYGEDGTVQRLLDNFAVPYTGSDAFSSRTAFNKHHTREEVTKLGIKVAHGIVVERGDTEALAHKLFRTFPHPAIVKPVSGGSSVGTTVADSFHALERALDTAFAIAPEALVEEFIKGKEATVGVIDNFRNEKTYALMPVEYGTDVMRVPGNFSQEEKRHLSTLARMVHEGLNLSHYSRSDFIVSRRGIYFLEVNTLPGLTKESLLPKALQAVGATLSQFLEHVIDLARRRQIK